MKFGIILVALFVAVPAFATEISDWECSKPRHLGGAGTQTLTVHIYGHHGWSIELDGVADPVKERVTFKYGSSGLRPLLNGKPCRLIPEEPR